MPWPFKARPPIAPCFPVGPYKIDDTISGLQGLSPLLPAELLALNTAVQFVGEKILHAPDADFMCLKWDTILGTVNGVIYKIAIRWTGPRTHTGKTYVEILRYCTRLYGEGKNMTLGCIRRKCCSRQHKCRFARNSKSLCHFTAG
jgi:hypothetical protein